MGGDGWEVVGGWWWVGGGGGWVVVGEWVLMKKWMNGDGKMYVLN